MTIQTHCEDRKEMVRKLSAFLAIPSVYLRAPTYGFQLGGITVNRDASVTGEGEELSKVAAWLVENGYADEQAVNETQAVENEASDSEAPEQADVPVDTPVQLDPAIQDGEQVISELRERLGDNLPAPTGSIDVEQEEKNGHITTTLIHMCETGWTMTSMKNLIQILYTRQDLINAMLKMDTLRIDDEVADILRDARFLCVSDLETMVHDERHIGMIEGMNISGGTVTMEMPFDEQMPERWMLYGALMAAIIKQAKAANRAKAIRLQEETGKYHANSWLNRLGFGGAEHKDFRHSMMAHLPGYAAFKSDAKMQKHKDKLAEQRRIAREMREEEHTDD